MGSMTTTTPITTVSEAVLMSLRASEQRLAAQLATVRAALTAGHNAALLEVVQAHYPGAWKLYFSRDPETGKVRTEWVEHGAGIPMDRVLELTEAQVERADVQIDKVLAGYPFEQLLNDGVPGWMSYERAEDKYHWDSGYLMLEELPTDVTVADHLLG